jgi:hypothetical protein
MTLSQVPNFYCRIVWGRDEESSIGVESHLIDNILMSIIMLEESVASKVPNLNAFVCTTTGNASTIWVKLHWINNVFMIIKAVNWLLLCDIPELYSSIIWSRTYKSCIRRELARSYPVRMSLKSKLELSVMNLEHFQGLVIGTRE